MKLGASDYNKDWWLVMASPMNSYNKDISNWQPIYEWITERIEGRVLDMGCGFGHLARELRRHHIKVVGVDFSTTALSVARKRNPDVTFLCEDIETTTLIEQGDYDTICFTEVLEHIEDDLNIIKRIPKGKTIFISVPQQRPQKHDQHVHFFSTKKEVKERYRNLIYITEMEIITEYKFIVLKGVRK